MFVWTPSMQIDGGQIDADHQTLITIANRVLVLDHPNQQTEALKLLIQELYDYAKYHFNREETFMRRLGYPDWEAHHAKHGAIIKEMNHYLTSAHHLSDLLNNFQELVEKWVIQHIMAEDRKIHAFMEAKLAASKSKF